MSFSSIAIEQRSKEAQALRLFLGYSLVGSLALHIALLASGIGNFLARVPAGEEEPIEILIVDAPAPEIEKVLIEEKKELPDKVVSRTPEKLPVIAQKQSIAPAPVQKLVEKPQIQPIQRQPKQTIQPYKPSTSARNPIVSNAVTPSYKTTQTSTGTGGGSGSSSSSELTSTGNSGGSGYNGGTRILTGTGIGIGSGTGTGTGIGSGSGTGTGNGTGSGNGSGTGTGTGNGTGSGDSVAVAPKPPKIAAPSNRGSGNGRAACRQCDSRYPEQARRRGVEGKVGVAVDTDANGNVTNVRLTRSSGSRDLDEAHLRQAREWKLKPSEGGRQGVSIETDYAMRGSRRYREAQERKRQRQVREAEQRNQPTATANQSSTTETPRRRRRLTSGTIVDVPPEPRQRRESASASENTPLRRQLRQRINTNTPQPRPSQAATSSSENKSPGVQRRRRRRPDSAATSDSTSKLRNALRRSRQQSESAPAAPSSEPKSNE